MIRNGSNIVDLEVFKTPCKGCGKTFVNLQARKFCSNTCREAHYRAGQAAIRESLPSLPAMRCRGCGAEFFGRRRRYCTPECRAAAQRSVNTRQCVGCGHEFVSPKSERCRDCRIVYERMRQHQAAIRRRKTGETKAVAHSQIVGAKGEMLFDLLSASMGWVSCRPTMEVNPGFDRVLIRNGAIERVQVKAVTGSRFEPGDKWELGGGFARLDWSAFDCIAVVDAQTADVWIIPKQELSSAQIYMANYEQHRFNPFDCQ